MNVILSIFAVCIAIVTHEWAHGYTSYLLGDYTAKRDGRLSLNPLHHIDLYGFLCLMIFHVGWAKPVQINPYMYKNRKLGTAITAFAGPCMNFIVAFVCILVMGFIEKFDMYEFSIFYFMYKLFLQTAIISIGLALFNLIPIPPLDGSKIIATILPDCIYNKLMMYEKYGFIILLFFLLFGFDAIIDPILSNVFTSMYEFVFFALKLGYV